MPKRTKVSTGARMLSGIPASHRGVVKAFVMGGARGAIIAGARTRRTPTRRGMYTTNPILGDVLRNLGKNPRIRHMPNVTRVRARR